ncbi:hypothetical protein TNCV_959201 [Trichonephila clavipes]|nr:hypothetical protein TNCV_959201 [Trichonephila clavipes]
MCVDFPLFRELLQRVQVTACQNVWFLQDSEAAQFSIVMRNHHHATYLWRWIGRAQPVVWPSHTHSLLSRTSISRNCSCGTTSEISMRRRCLQWRLQWHISSLLQLTLTTYRNCLNASDNPSSIGVGCSRSCTIATSNIACDYSLSLHF